MRILRSLLFVLLSVSIPLALAAQQSPPSASSAAAILQKALAALVGSHPVSDVTLTGTARRIAGSDDESGSFSFKATLKGEARADMVFPSGPRTEMRAISADSSVGRRGSRSGPEGVSKEVPYFNLLTESAWFFPSFVLQHVVSGSEYSAVDLGREARESLEVEHVSVTYLPGRIAPEMIETVRELSKTEIYLDTSTMKPVSISFNLHPDNAWRVNIPVEIKFSDYRPTDAGLVPFRIQKYIQNVLVQDLQIQTVQINTGLSSSTIGIE